MGNFCRKCGQPLESDYKVCPFCGTKTDVQPKKSFLSDTNFDDNEIIWAIVGALLPVVGVILFLIWNNEKPLTAKYVGIGALIGFAFRTIFGFTSLFFIFPLSIFTVLVS